MKKMYLMIVAAVAACGVRADVKLAAPFNDGMVLQREKPVAVWGTAAAGEKVTVLFAGQSVSTTAGADGRWIVHLAPLKWDRLAPGRQKSFSTLAFHYGLILHRTLKVPVGVVVSAWGGTYIEPWISPDGSLTRTEDAI